MKYRFNNIEIDTDNFRLVNESKEISVEPQVFNLIALLIENKDKVVSRDFILNHIWKGRVVSDTSINNHIKSARKVLGDDGIKQQVIKTIHSRGYQFIAKLESNAKAVSKSEPKQKSKKRPLIFAILLMVLLVLFFALKYYNHYELKQSVKRIANYQEASYVTFVAQAKRRNELVEMIESRIGDKREMQFEKYFSYYFDKLNNEEKFVFGQIRGMTEIGLYQNNLKIVNELNNNPQILDQIPGTKELLQHLEFWLNKYHGVFTQREDICLLYVGVEDGVAYPSEVNKNIEDWLGIKETTSSNISQKLTASEIETNEKIQKLIAVLPFANTKPDDNADYLSFALANQIISDLTYLEKYSTRPAGSIRKYVGQIIDPIAVGEELKVDFVISGNYLLENDTIRLAVEMIEVKSSQLIWRETMQVNYSDTFSLQDMVAQKVAKGLDVGFRKNHKNQKHRDIPNSALAFEYYLRGISYPQSNEGHHLAVKMLQKSIELDPNYAPSYSHLGFHRRLLEQHGRIVPVGLENAEWYYQKALQLNPQLLDALSNLSALYAETNRTEEAMLIIKKMININPNDANSHFALGYIYRYAGMLDEAIESMETALVLSPNNKRFRSIISTYLSAGKYQKALSKVYLDTGDYGTGYSGIIAYEQENYELSKELFNQVLEIDANGIWGLISQVYLAVMDDDKERGLKALTKMVDTNVVDAENMYYFADFYAMLEKKGESLDMLEKAVESGYFNYPHISHTPSFNFLQEDVRFIAILQKAKQRHDAFRKNLL